MTVLKQIMFGLQLRVFISTIFFSSNSGQPFFEFVISELFLISALKTFDVINILSSCLTGSDHRMHVMLNIFYRLNLLFF